MANPTLDYADSFAHKVVSTNQFGGSGVGLYDEATSTSMMSFAAGRYGGTALKITKTAGAGAWVSRIFSTVGAQKSLSFYLYFDSPPASDQSIFSFYTTGAVKVDIRSKSGNFAIGWGGTNTDSGVAIATGTWQRIDLKADCSGTTYTASAKVDGGSTFTKTLTGQVADTFNIWRYGTTESAAVFTGRIADLVEGSTISEWPYGAHQVISIVPDDDGDSQDVSGGGTKGGGGGASRIENSDGTHTYFSYVDSWPPALATYVTQVAGGATNYMEVTFPDLTQAGSLVGEVLILFAMSATGSAHNDSTARYLDPSNTVDAFTGTMGSTALNYRVGFIGDITLTNLQAATARWGFSTDQTPSPRVNGVMLTYVRWQGTVASSTMPFTTTPAMTANCEATFRGNVAALTTTPAMTAVAHVPTRDSAALTTTPSMSVIGRRKQFDTIAFATTPAMTVAGSKFAFGVAALATTPSMTVVGRRGQNTQAPLTMGTPVLSVVTGVQTVLGQIGFTTTPSMTVAGTTTAGAASTGIINFTTTAPFMDVFGTRVGTPFYMGSSLLRKEWLRDISETGGVERGRAGLTTSPSMTVVGRQVFPTIVPLTTTPVMGVTGRRGQFGIAHLATTPAMTAVGTRLTGLTTTQVAFFTNPVMNVLGRVIPIPTPNQVFFVTNPRMTAVGQAIPRFVVKGTCDLEESVRTVALVDFDSTVGDANIGAALGVTVTLDQGEQ